MVRSLLLLAPVFAFAEIRGSLSRKSARKEPHNVAQAIAGMGLDWDMNRIGDKSLLNATADANATFDNGESVFSADWDADNSSSHQPTAADIAAANAAAAAARQRKLRSPSATASAAPSESGTHLKTVPGVVVSVPDLKTNTPHEARSGVAPGASAEQSRLITPHAMVVPKVNQIHRGMVIVVKHLNSTGTRSPSMQYALSEACRAEMSALTANATQAAKASLCERRANFTAKAIAALRAGDSHGAVHGVEAAFMRCSQMEPQCARDIATQVVQKLRVSGMALDGHCRAVQENVSNEEFSDNDLQCMETTAGHVITALKMSNSSDMGFEVALRFAAEGLHKCQKVQAPCDFQIAPFALKGIVQDFLEEDKARVEASLAQYFAAGQSAAAALAAEGSLLQAAA